MNQSISANHYLSSNKKTRKNKAERKNQINPNYNTEKLNKLEIQNISTLLSLNFSLFK